MSCSGTSDCNCGCCAGTNVLTPQWRNGTLPGLDSVPYRVGAWASFKETMLARLSSADYPALADLKTRDDDDFTIAFLDANAIVLDILSFYQERLANESYLRTARQLRSLSELSRLIGYQPSPGVAASTYLAFSLKSAPGQPVDPNAPPTTIPPATQVQSIPAQGQTPQIFETSNPIQAKSDWSALGVLTRLPWIPQMGDLGVYLQGVATQLKPGDLILIVGDERLQKLNSTHWDIRVLTAVTADTANNRTYVTWDQGLGSSGLNVPPAQSHPLFYAFRQRANLFGYNAVSPLMLTRNAVTFLQNSPGNIQSAAPDPANRGSKYKVGDTINVTGGNGVNGVLTVTAADANGEVKVTGLAVVGSGGSGYGSLPAVATTGGSGTGLLVNITAASYNLLIANGDDWNFKASPSPSGSNFIHLDAVYPKIVPDSWIAMVDPNKPPPSPRSPYGYVTLYQAKTVSAISRSAYGQSGKITQISTDIGTNLALYYTDTRYTSVLAQSEHLAVADQPLDHPLYGTMLDLDQLRPDLMGVQVVALSGVQQKIAIRPDTKSLLFAPDDDSTTNAANPGDVFVLIDPSSLPCDVDGSALSWAGAAATLRVQDASGRTGMLQAPGNQPFPLAQVAPFPPAKTDALVSEFALVSSLSSVNDPHPHTRIQLDSPLMNCYERSSARVNANVGLATQGQSVTEILGSGNGSQLNPSFTPKQAPLTYVQAPTPTGRRSTLDVKVNGETWAEVPSLFDQKSTSKVYSTLNQPDGTADIKFGDGVEGALLPTGQNNVVANYRIGLGASGNVAANSLTMLMDRPLGVNAVINPEPATGGQDPESIEDIRSNAPLAVLTLGRAVSLSDYENYAATFAGISKAHALWIPGGPAFGVFLTVAAVGGAALPPGNPTLANLVQSLQNYGRPLIPITAQSFIETLFGLTADIAYDPLYDQAAVQAAVLQALYGKYSFAARSFGQGVSADEVAALIQSVTGVVATNVREVRAGASSAAGDLVTNAGGFSLARYYRWRSMILKSPLKRPCPNSTTRIYPYLPQADPHSIPQPAEILVLDPNPNSVVLGVMA
jgi:hypothetical protein